jgi:hypothetical protein
MLGIQAALWVHTCFTPAGTPRELLAYPAWQLRMYPDSCLDAQVQGTSRRTEASKIKHG